MRGVSHAHVWFAIAWSLSGGQTRHPGMKESAMIGSGTRATRRALIASILVAGLAIPVTVATASSAQTAAAPAVNAAAGPTVTRLADTELDPRALYFVSYDGLVNNASYQQDGILTFGGYQYAAWYTSSRRVVVARRQLPSGAWQTLQLAHSLTTNDSHNSISLGVSPSDGRLHVAMDTHDSRVFYVKSEAGLLTDAGSRSWTATALGAVQRTLDGLELGAITYPQFAITPERRLQLSYRTGGSGNGTNELVEYDGSTWRRLGRWSSATGNWTQHGATSTRRNMYLHGLTYGLNGRLHAAFTWREQNAAVMCNRGGLSNHDTGYVYSDDRGRTWRNNAGQQVGTTNGTLVSVTSPGHVVDALNADHALINQESQTVDSTGQPHVIISYVPGRFTQCVTNFTSQRRSYARAFHLVRNAQGAWRKVEIPVALNAFGRSQIVLDRADNAYVVLPYGRIVTASKASGWTDWTLRFDGSGLNAFGEVVVDRSRVTTDGVLSILYQRRSSGTTPSSIRVVDFSLG
ncbi:BNR repeat-containing protein [Micromonospora sp. KC723]|uniref:BNR repeat-containing protein n=1 Tax=Micromonospora sp. KC723 TaxID=2530381 RepID=UPI001A9FDE62|nr:BNR repeat-containing protein [Micromonospora sp. KC723]